ncbi:restriction endonuclease [Vibrio sp. Vb2201]|uniref:restriction endonuclease n=1 Tax=Vibrio sp. Vb2201 TaxID=3074655 RepID=UPI002964AA25|nr:restriction endonuclease [Vibrio sp. Vb2201]MDW1798981.1 restriction endonuclease [Vibrio sp. Vb2201]
MEGYLQMSIGIIVSIVLFWLSYRQTIGAKKERTKNANKSMHRAVLRRMVLEEYSPNYKELVRVREGKAREFNTSPNDMLSEEQVLNSIYTEVFDSDLISPSQRVVIEARLDSVFAQFESRRRKTTLEEYKYITASNKKRRDLVIGIATIASALGALTSILYSYIESSKSNSVEFSAEWIVSGLSVFALSIAMIYLSSLAKKIKEEPSTLETRGAAVIASNSFEMEVARALEKSGISYRSEPKVGHFRPDFLVTLNGENIAIETRSWSNLVPLNSMRKTLRMLESMTHHENIDSAILVTKKSVPAKGLYSESSSINVLDMNQFQVFIKSKKAA